jgi:hypothetical protein
MYGKIFASIYKGSMRGKADPQAVLIYMIANCDKSGCLDETQQCIAEAIGRPVEAVREACLFLEAADPESRSTDEEGARIVRVAPPRTWGWRIVNHAKYVAIRNEEDRRAQSREAMRRLRSKDVSTSEQMLTPVNTREHLLADVNTVSHGEPRLAHADADTDADATTTNTAAVAAPRQYDSPFDDSLAATKALTPNNYMDWKCRYRAILAFSVNHGAGDADWAALFNEHGYDDMTAAAEFLKKQLQPGKRLWPDQFAKLAKD